MPRPKRAKVAPSAPTAIMMKKTEKSLPQLELSPASASISSGRATNASDDSEGVVTKSLMGVNRKGVAPMAVFMSGGLAVEDVGEKRPKPLSTRKRVALSRIARQADHTKAMEDLKVRRNAIFEKGNLAKEPEDSRFLAEVTDAAKVPALMKAPSTAPLTTTVHIAKPNPVAKTQATPLRETSILAVENFKRRPRQPSILQIAKAQIATPEPLEDDDTLDDFAPEGESTPFQKSNAENPNTRSSNSSNHSRKRKLSTPQIQVPASQPQDLQNQSRSPPSSPPEDIFDIIAADSQLEPVLPTLPKTGIASSHQPLDSDTLAPPDESSPRLPSPQKPPQKPKVRNKTTQRTRKPDSTSKTPVPEEIILPPRSPTPTQPSPTIPTPHEPARSPPKPLTTSALQNLLPRRRNRLASKTTKENSIFDLGSSSSEINDDVGDEDELSFHARVRPAAAARQRGKENRKGVRAARGARGKKGEVGKKVKKSAAGGGGRSSATYTRKSQLEEAEPDYENDDDDYGDVGNGDGDGSSVTVPAGGMEEPVKLGGKAREEMKRLRHLFREVDEWGLEFEEVTGSSDRMRDAR
ncbi:MAG: hypothetical protein L6R37_004948 [Teloschistes peruensis]|nr:MAG: hypothetical protein L6R37_004948 [Teloschistes peruensis]